jgi:hypothetical protein
VRKNNLLENKTNKSKTSKFNKNKAKNKNKRTNSDILNINKLNNQLFYLAVNSWILEFALCLSPTLYYNILSPN